MARTVLLVALVAQTFGLVLGLAQGNLFVATLTIIAAACSLWTFILISPAPARDNVSAMPGSNLPPATEQLYQPEEVQSKRMQQRLFGDNSASLASEETTSTIDLIDSLLPPAGSGDVTTAPSGNMLAHPPEPPTPPLAPPSERVDPPPVFDGQQLARECVLVFAEMDALQAKSSGPQSAVATHVAHELRNALEECGVEVIDRDTAFDLLRHKPANPLRDEAPQAGAPIAEVISPGFVLNSKVLRRAIVRLA